jgi:hypothetical protein
MPKRAKILPTHVIREDKDNIRLPIGWFSGEHLATIQKE